LQVEGIIHPSFNLTGTRTGRTSSSGPNLQQVPPKLYRLFRPRFGHAFIQFDLAGIEAALIALYSGDKTIYDILANGDSIHDHNVHTLLPLFGLPATYCEVSEVAEKLPAQRKTIKNIGFAIFYGAGWRRISQVFAAGGFPITDAQAKHGLSLLKKKYTQVFEFHKEITEVFEAGETVRNMFGRPITLQAHDNPYMQGFNTLIQSSASDLNLRGCEKAWKENSSATPLLVIHDFIMLEAPSDKADEAAKILTRCMTDFKLDSVNGPIQLKVEGGVSEIWEK
jgi:DNA polymerase-1